MYTLRSPIVYTVHSAVDVLQVSPSGILLYWIYIIYTVIRYHHILHYLTHFLSSVHDPSVAGPLSNPSWLPAATSHTNARVIIDRFGQHNDDVVHQENPLIAQSIWENCRPSQQAGVCNNNTFSSDTGNTFLDMGQAWGDTYQLVSNCGTSTFTGDTDTSKHPSSAKLSDLQKLCIIRLLRGGDGLSCEKGSSELHKDYTFAASHSLLSELCMILQTRYFLLLDVDFTSADNVSSNDIVEEISYEEFKYRTTPWSHSVYPFNPSVCITAHEVAFSPKGDKANVSIWFDAEPIKLEPSQIKRSRRLKQKKKTKITNHTAPNANGALICRTTSLDFPTGPIVIEPFVPMIPAENNDQSHNLLLAIIEHRIDSLIIENCSHVTDEQMAMFYTSTKELNDTFASVFKFHRTWVWPKREGLDEITKYTLAPPGNIMPYIIPSTTPAKNCMNIWQTFVEIIGLLKADNESAHVNANRLSALPTFDDSVKVGTGRRTNLPRITPDSFWTNPKNDNTWGEVVLGLPEDSKWNDAIRLHEKKKKLDIDAHNNPLSTIHFVQP